MKIRVTIKPAVYARLCEAIDNNSDDGLHPVLKFHHTLRGDREAKVFPVKMIRSVAKNHEQIEVDLEIAEIVAFPGADSKDRHNDHRQTPRSVPNALFRILGLFHCPMEALEGY